MQFAIISGSHRKKSQSRKVADYLALACKKQEIAGEIIDLAGNPLPLWDEGIWEDKNWQNGAFVDTAQKLEDSDASIIIAPEWAGMAPAGLKNLFLLCGKQMADKPALIVGVSSGIGGTYPVAELRFSSCKNTRIVYTPDHLILRQVESLLNDPNEPASEIDSTVRERIDYSLQVLASYAKALGAVRESGVLDYKSYPFGM